MDSEQYGYLGHGILRKVGRKRVVTHAYQHHGPGYNAVQKKRPGYYQCMIVIFI